MLQLYALFDTKQAFTTMKIFGTFEIRMDVCPLQLLSFNLIHLQYFRHQTHHHLIHSLFHIC